METTKVIDLSNVCPEALAELERLHYEVVTKERIIGIAINSSISSNVSIIDKYYADYVETFKKCEMAKQKLYENYLIQENADGYFRTWEADFLHKSVIFHA